MKKFKGAAMENNRFVTPKTEYQVPGYKIMDSISDWVRIIDNEGYVIFANRSMRKSFSIDPVGKKCWDYKDDEIPNSITPPESAFLGVIKDEIQIRGRTYSVKSSPILTDDGYVYGTIEVFRDITKETEMNNKLVQTNKQILDEIRLARNIQHHILPKKGKINGLNIDYRYLSSEGLSGDIFDVFEIDENHVVLYIADVVGHGIGASILTMFVRQAIRNVVSENKILCPNFIFRDLTKRFKDLNLESDKYFTIFLGIYDRQTKEFIYANAGHNAIPILFNKTDCQLLDAKGFPITCVFDNASYENHKIQLQQHDKLLLYTDGLTESKNFEKEELGLDKLLDIIKADCGYVLSDIVETIKQYIWGSIDDDIAMLLMEIL